MEPHLTPAELAQRERVSVETVYAWNRSRTGPTYIRVGRHIRYPVAAVMAWERVRTVVRTGSAV